MARLCGHVVTDLLRIAHSKRTDPCFPMPGGGRHGKEKTWPHGHMNRHPPTDDGKDAMWPRERLSSDDLRNRAPRTGSSNRGRGGPLTWGSGYEPPEPVANSSRPTTGTADDVAVDTIQSRVALQIDYLAKLGTDEPPLTEATAFGFTCAYPAPGLPASTLGVRLKHGSSGMAMGGQHSVYVGNLGTNVEWQDLRNHFQQIGAVWHADVNRDGKNRSKGDGIVTYDNAKDAQSAIATLNGTVIKGRKINVRPDKEARETTVMRTIELSSFDAAQKLYHYGCLRPAVLNFANEYNCGGAWCDRPGSQEEDLFRRSTLPLSLWPRRREDDDRLEEHDHKWPPFTKLGTAGRWDLPPLHLDGSAHEREASATDGDSRAASTEPPLRAQRPLDATMYPLAEAGVIYSPCVRITHDANGAILPQPSTPVAVISSAAQDLRDWMAHYRGPYNEALTTQKLRSILWAAASQGHSSLVLGAYGCGAFRNDAATIAALFHKLLTTEFKDRFRVVLFAIIKSDKSLAAFSKLFPMFSRDDEILITQESVGWHGDPNAFDRHYGQRWYEQASGYGRQARG